CRQFFAPGQAPTAAPSEPASTPTDGSTSTARQRCWYGVTIVSRERACPEPCHDERPTVEDEIDPDERSDHPDGRHGPLGRDDRAERHGHDAAGDRPPAAREPQRERRRDAE